mgnify:CR=1 FL=1
MTTRWLLMGMCLFPMSAFADQACFRRSTDTLIEYQSRADIGTCTQNAAQAGIPLSDIDERTVTDVEWKALEQRYIRAPNQLLADAKEQGRKDKAARVRAKLGLSPSEFEDLREAVR